MIPQSVILIFEITLFVSMILCFFRMAIGPTAADRMVAVDLLALLIAILMMSHVIRKEDEAVLDVVLIFSILAFFGTVALARYLQREHDHPRPPDSPDAP